MKNILVILFCVFAATVFADAPKEACTCMSGGTCACPEGKCTCAAAAAPAAEGKNCGCACCVGKAVCCCHAGEEAAASEAPGHALKGVVVDVLAGKQSLLVKHEEIPGVMKAMTMLFHVEADTLAAVKKGDTITARMTNEDGGWWLREVKKAAAQP